VSLADSLANAKPYKTSKPCAVHELLAVLAPSDRAALVSALAIRRGEPGRISNQQLSDILKTEGHDVSMKVIEVHRKGACSCDALG
jgi:hypothetical protein